MTDEIPVDSNWTTSTLKRLAVQLVTTTTTLDLTTVPKKHSRPFAVAAKPHPHGDIRPNNCNGDNRRDYRRRTTGHYP